MIMENFTTLIMEMGELVENTKNAKGEDRYTLAEIEERLNKIKKLVPKALKEI